MNDYNIHIGSNGNGSNGVGILTVIQIVLIILKLCHLIDIPWKLVLIPLWISIGLSIVVLVILAIYILISRTNC